MRMGIQKTFPGFMSSLGFTDEAMCLKYLTELMLGCFCDPKCRDARYVAAYDCILTGHKRSAQAQFHEDRKSTRLNSSHVRISYAVFCLKKKKNRFDIIILYV